MNKCAVILFVVSLVLQNSSGLEYNKHQRLNANTDFLLHEGGVQNAPKVQEHVAPGAQSQTNTQQNGGTTSGNKVTTGPQHNPQSSNGKRDYVAPQFPTLKPPQQNTHQSGGAGHAQPSNNNHNAGKNDYVSQFPSLGPPSGTQSPTPATNGWQRNPLTNNGKRDYVAPQKPTHNNRQDNAAQYPPLGPTSAPQPTPASNNKPQPSTPTGKRDYVNPQYPTAQPASGKVKDLINFYDSKNSSPGTSSYSSIAQGSSHRNGPSSMVTKPSQITTAIVTPKPMSFSSVVSGNKINSQSSTPKPTTRNPSTPTRTGTPVLPSSIVNNNKGSANDNTVTDDELVTISEELLRKDNNNAAKYLTVNYQEKTTSQSKEDKAPLPLLTVGPEVWNISTIQKFVPLLDNYERDTLVNEHVTPQERNEENAFMDAVMSTTVMRHLMTFLKNKGYVTPDPKQQRDYLKQMWFSLYSRGKGKISSSGFEHVFVSELKNGVVSGLHNWIYFSREEAANRINYLGYLKYVLLNEKGAILKFHFNQQGVDKPVNSIFIGTSPELEMALYTLCFVTRADKECKLKLANKDVNIVTYNFRYRSKNLIGSAFAEI
ncbi:unnamed protein product [Chrysodeixis includens]|uniref:EndoU domain-containing protein n=1 Tax=Chrysodeixis includens TaxID=689277 RepID=A0A9P0FSP0_CHRIL|nr:unnamed protein product [Chrysodeixis includens]